MHQSITASRLLGPPEGGRSFDGPPGRIGGPRPLIRPTNILPALYFFGIIDRMNPHNTTVTNPRHVAVDAGRAAFAGCGQSFSIIRIIQGR